MNGVILKSIGFPIDILECIDESAKIENLSRSAFVVNAVREYLIAKGYDKQTDITF